MSNEKSGRKEKKTTGVQAKAPPTSRLLKSFDTEFSSRIASMDIAEKGDNVGFIIESPRACLQSELRVLLCIDLTEHVVAEAARKQCNLIIAYHSVIFRPIQNLSMTTYPTVLRCLDAGLSVFTPHTAMDNAPCGMNDFMFDLLDVNEAGRTAIRVDAACGAHVGRLSTLNNPVSLQSIIQTLKFKLGVETIRYACPIDKTSDSIQINSIAVYVGSGAFALLGAPADLYITGEMFHHDILATVAAGKVVILLDHSSSERPFLAELAKRLKEFTDVSQVSVAESDIEPIRAA